MKTVLLLADEFPPAGWSGVQRPLKFVQCLQRLDFGSSVTYSGSFGRRTTTGTCRDA